MIRHRYLCAEFGYLNELPPTFYDYNLRRTWIGRICIVSNEGHIEWEYPADQCCDVSLLPNGNILYSYVNGVREIRPDKSVAWEYITGDETYSCQRLPNGDTLIGFCAKAQILEVTPDGDIRKILQVDTPTRGHNTFRIVRKLENGHYLVPLFKDGVVHELDEDGKLVWSTLAPNGPCCAIRLSNGNTLIAGGDAREVREVNPSGKIVWLIGESDLPNVSLQCVTAVQRLPNGNTVIVNWQGRKNVGKGAHVIEVTPQKQIVWEADCGHKLHKTVFNVQLLD